MCYFCAVGFSFRYRWGYCQCCHLLVTPWCLYLYLTGMYIYIVIPKRKHTKWDIFNKLTDGSVLHWQWQYQQISRDIAFRCGQTTTACAPGESILAPCSMWPDLGLCYPSVPVEHYRMLDPGVKKERTTHNIMVDKLCLVNNFTLFSYVITPK